MPNEETTTATPPASGLTAPMPAAAPATQPATDPPAQGAAPAGEPKKPPGSDEWAKRDQLEKSQRARAAKLKSERAELDARAKTVADQEAVLAAVRDKDAGAIIKLIGADGFQKLTAHMLSTRMPKAGASPAQQQKAAEDVNEIVRKAIADHDAAKEKTAAEERDKQSQAAAAAADAKFATLTKQSVDLVKAGGERYAQIALELTGSPEAEKLFDSTLRAIDKAISSPDGWKIGDKVLKGQVGLDVALEALDTYLSERALALLSPKVRARLSGPAEKSAEEGGTRKSTSSGSTTLTQRLSTETPPSHQGPPANESPLAKKQREERELEARTIAETEAILAKAAGPKA